MGNIKDPVYYILVYNVMFVYSSPIIFISTVSLCGFIQGLLLVYLRTTFRHVFSEKLLIAPVFGVCISATGFVCEYWILSLRVIC